MTDNRTTELLHKLLDEYGIEYAESRDRFRTRFRFNYCEACCDYLDEIEVTGACITVSKSYLTPEQAVAVTLGSDRDKQTCKVVSSYYYDDYDFYEFEFSCGHSVNMYDKEPTNFCPMCGKKVER